MSSMANMGAKTIGDFLREARAKLSVAPFEPETREASLILAQVLGRNEAHVLAYPEKRLSEQAVAQSYEFLTRRLAGEPVAYLFGEREFYGRPFYVDHRVLIPRPETEHLVEAVLTSALPPEPFIVDVGTGSGCLAVTLACELPGARLLATDLSIEALQVARSNTQRHGVARRVRLANVDLLSALRLENVDLIVSNPPYIDALDTEQLSIEVKNHEPHLALFAPGRGTSVLADLLHQAKRLSPGAHLFSEIGYDQAEWLAAAVAGENIWELVEIVRDYASIPRTAVLRRRAS